MKKKKLAKLTKEIPSRLRVDNQTVVVIEKRRSGIKVYYAFSYSAIARSWHDLAWSYTLDELLAKVNWAFRNADINNAPLFGLKS